MALLHRSFDVQSDVWKRLRLNAEESGVPIRDFLAFLISRSMPIPEGDSPERRELVAMVEANRQAAASGSVPMSKPCSSVSGQ